MKPTKLISKRLNLRRAHNGDADHLFRYTSDLECSKFLTRAPHVCIDQTKKFLDKWCDLPWDEESNNFSWVVSLASNDEAIGIFLSKIEDHQAEVHFGIRREYWHQGYATEVLKIGTDWLLSNESIQRIWTVCDLENTGSFKALEKSGFMREGVLKNRLVIPAFGAQARDCYLYTRLKNENIYFMP